MCRSPSSVTRESGTDALEKYLQQCKEVGFDIVEISSGFISISIEDWLRLVEKVQTTGLKAKPEFGIQFGAGGATSATWRTDVITKFATSLGFEHLMFEAADPEVFSWYIKNYGPDVNLFIDHSQIVQVECLRSGILGHKEHMGTHPQLSVIEDRAIIMLPDIRR